MQFEVQWRFNSEQNDSCGSMLCVAYIGWQQRTFILHLLVVWIFPKSPPAQGLRQYEEDKYSAQQGKAAHDNEGQGQPDAGKGGLFSQLLSLV